jgi:hypothetical protein
MAEATMCSMFCGGKNCKYESAAKWSKEQQAIDGLYSNWSVSLLRQSLILKILLLYVKVYQHHSEFGYFFQAKLITILPIIDG